MMFSRTIRYLLAPLTHFNVTSLPGSLHSPVSRLPAEILSIIFELSKPQYLKLRLDGNGLTLLLRPLEDELPVLYVSRSWRNIAVSVLDLSPIPIFLDITTPSTNNAIVRNHVNSVIAARLEQYLARTAPDPLFFRVYNWNANRFTSDESAVKILRLLCKHSDRWVDVSLHLLPSTWYSILNDIRSPLRRLRSLELRDTEVRPYHALVGGQALTPSFMNTGDELSSLTLGCSMLSKPDALRIPWSRLTNITLAFVNPPNFHFILIHCVNLREYYLKEYNRTSVNWTPPATPIAHFALRKMRLKSCNLSHFLPLVHAPNVEELHVDCSVFAAADVLPLSTLPSLRILHLQFVFAFLHEDLVSPLLEQSSGIEELYLDFLSGMPDGAIDSLAKSSEIVPGLRHLRLKLGKVGDEDALMRMIERRMMSTAGEERLRSLKFEGGSLSEHTVGHLRHLAAAGLAIEGLDSVTELRRKRGWWLSS